MLADFFTKPLQGNLFRKFQDVIMGHKHINSLKQETTPAPSQERVGGNRLLENVRNGANGQKTDMMDQKPVRATYADITREEVHESVRREESRPLTLKNSSHCKNSFIGSFYRYIPSLSFASIRLQIEVPSFTETRRNYNNTSP
jgi:hypothetical protein